MTKKDPTAEQVIAALTKFMLALASNNDVPKTVSDAAAQFRWDIGDRD